MEKTNMKNIVVLKNLPSNLVDEAIVILKANKKIKKAEQVIKNVKTIQKDEQENPEEYILKEAEMIVSNYISKVEGTNNWQENGKLLKNKYKKVKGYSVIVTFLLFISIILNLI